MSGLGKSPLAGLAALGLGGLAPTNTGGLNPAGIFLYPPKPSTFTTNNLFTVSISSIGGQSVAHIKFP